MKSPWEVTENPGPIPCRILPEKKHIPLPMLLQQKKSIKKTDAYNTATVNGKFPSQSHVTLEPGTGDGIGKMTKTAGTVEPTEDGKYVPWEATLTIPKGTYKDGEITYTDTLYGTHEFAGTLSTNADNQYLKIEVTKGDGSSLDVKVTNQTKNSFQLSFPALTLKQAETVKNQVLLEK